MKRSWHLLLLLALAAPCAASGWSDLDLGLYGMLGRVFSPDSMDTCRSAGGGLDLDYRLGRLDGVDVALGLNGQLASFANNTATTQALSAGLNLRFSLFMGANLNLQAGYCPLAGQDSRNWGGHFMGAASLGNRGWFSDNFGLDTALTYAAYSPQANPLQSLGVRLGLMARLAAPATMDAAKAPPPELSKQEAEQKEEEIEKEKIAAPKGAPLVKEAAMPAVDSSSDSAQATGDHP